MSLSPFDKDLELFMPDALAFLDAVDSRSDGVAPLVGAEDDVGAAEDLDTSFLTELLAVATPEHSALANDNSDGLALNESVEVELTGSDEIPSDSATSPPSSFLSQDLSAHAGASSEANEEEEDSPQGRRLRRRAIGSRLLRKRKKARLNEMAELRKQAIALGVHLDRLRSSRKKMRGDVSVAEWEERAIAQRHQREQAEELNEQLKRALYEQRGLIHELRSVLSSSPLVGSELNLHRVLHSYIRLGTHPRSRYRDFQSICTNARLDLALRIVDRETGGGPFDTPSISTQQIPTQPNECGLNTVAVYAFQTGDISKIFSDACLAIVGSRSEKPDHTMTSMRAEVVDEPSPQIRYAISDGTYTNDATGEKFRVASRIISFYRVTDEYSLLLWDFVDVDDLSPVRLATHTKSDVVGAIVVRREVCADGVERVVCRYVCTKVHRLSRLAATSSLERFLVSGAQLCTYRVYQQIKERNTARQVAVCM